MNREGYTRSSSKVINKAAGRASGGVPAPTPPNPGALTETSTRSDDPRRSEKRRRTRIKRLYGEDKGRKYWVDIEVVDNATSSGSQFPGPLFGNQALDTILKPDNCRNREGREKEEVPICMDPSNPKAGPNVKIQRTKKMVFQTKGGERLERTFNNSRKNYKRISVPVKIKSNNIDKQFMKDDKDAADPEKQKQPQSRPKKYRQSVYDTDDSQTVYLNVLIPVGFKTQRAKTTQYQYVNNENIFCRKNQKLEPTGSTGNRPSGPVSGPTATLLADGDTTAPSKPAGKRTTLPRLPGAEPGQPKEDIPRVILDPYQTVVNFGPDSLAVHFKQEADTSGTGPKPPALGGSVNI